MNEALEVIKTWAAIYGIQIVGAILILVIGLWAAKIIKKFLAKILEKKNLDPAISSFIGNLAYAILIVFVIIATLANVGIQTTSFIAVIGAAGLAIGLALQGALSNFAAGFLLILFRPFKAGDFIEASGVAGSVQEIQILYTQLKTPENIKVIVPNGQIMGGNITNYSANDTRRAEWIFGVGYEDDMKKVRGILNEIILSDERILTDPAPQILLKELGDSSVNFAVRAFIGTGDFWSVYFEITEKVKARFDEEGINIPFPQRDVHLYQAQQ
jgi:small conductance mechanosensitive channel